MQSRRLGLILAALIFGFSAPAFAQTATANLSVSASVIGTCTISTTAVNFGTYDPVVANATTPLDNTGSVIVTCTKGAGTRIDLDLGTHSSGTTRRMLGSPDFLTFELYQDSGRTLVWGSGVAGGQTITPALSTAPRTFSVFGRVAAGQNVGAASYTDTVVATINF